MSLRSEIFEQPSVLDRLLATQLEPARAIAEAVRRRGAQWVLVAARGSSDNAALYAKYLWGSWNGLAVALATPSLFTLYGTPPRLTGALVVGISQSGRSPDIVSVLAEGRRQGALTLAITNDPDSPLAAAAELVLATAAGPELAIAATKTYAAQLLAIALLATALREDSERETALHAVPALVAEALTLDRDCEQAARGYRAMTQCAVLGRGFNYATAHEWSLKLKELTYVAAQPYSSADFRHGPLAMVGRGFPILAVAPGGAVFADLMALLSQLVSERGAELVAISDQPAALALARTPLRLPEALPEWLSPLVGVVPAQLFSYHLARAMGRDEEAPRGLRKVTETW
jgi:glucosamine--fructose-6-phosphate aminotransferase (isomerizing)